MSQDLIEATQLRVMTVDEAQREHYKQELAAIQSEGPKVLAAIKNKEGVERAAAWRVRVRDFIRSVESGALGIASAMLHKRKKEIDAEINSYIDPCDRLAKDAKVRMDRWYTEEADRVRLAQIKAAAKATEKAELKQTQTVQVLMDLGKPKAAMAAAAKPLNVAPPTIEMPKIKNAIWKKQYKIQIEDLGSVLKYIAKHPEFHSVIDQKTLVSNLESLAAELDGNMQKFDGVKCLVTPNSVAVGGPK